MREHPWSQDALSDLIRWSFVLDLADRREPSLLDELESAELALWTQAYPLAEQVLERTEECCDHHLLRTVTTSEFIATIALTSAAVMHQNACRKPKDPRHTAPRDSVSTRYRSCSGWCACCARPSTSS